MTMQKAFYCIVHFIELSLIVTYKNKVYQHACQVYSNNSLKKEGFVKVGCIRYADKKKSWNVDSQYCSYKCFIIILSNIHFHLKYKFKNKHSLKWDFLNILLNVHPPFTFLPSYLAAFFLKQQQQSKFHPLL